MISTITNGVKLVNYDCFNVWIHPINLKSNYMKKKKLKTAKTKQVPNVTVIDLVLLSILFNPWTILDNEIMMMYHA